MKKVKNKNENKEKPLKKVDPQSKAIVSHEDKKEKALKVALAAKDKQLKKNPHVKKEKKGKVAANPEPVEEVAVTTEQSKESKKKNKKKTAEILKETEKPTSPEKKTALEESEQPPKKKKKKDKKPATETPATESSEPEPQKKKKKKDKKAEETPAATEEPAKKKKKKKVKKATDSENNEPKKPSDPECTVFVGNLAQNTKTTHLQSLFKTYGNVVSVRLRTALGNTLFKHKSRKETECLNGYVVFDSPENALKALELSGTEFRGRHIRVTKSLKGNFITDESSKRTIFVGNLKFKVTEETLHELFSSCGEIEAVRTMKNEQGCKGVGYVTFKAKEGVHLAQELNGTLVLGRPVRVEKYSGKKKPSKPKDEKAGGGKKKDKKVKGVKGAKGKEGEGKKKGDFRGVKTNAIKKKKFNKKKVGGNPFQRKLAKKIAPKEN